MTNQVIFIWLLTSSSCFLTCHTQVLYVRISPNQTANLAKRGKLSAMLLSAQLAYHAALWCHPSIKYGNWSFKDNKTKLPTGRVNTLQHTLVPQSSTGNVESLNLDQAQMGTTAHTAIWNGEKDGQLHRGSPDGTSQTSAACCMTRVGTEWELVHCPLPGCVCVCVFAIMTEFFWARHSRKKHL